MISRFVRILSLALLPLLAFAQTAEQPQARVARLEHAVLAPCCYTESVVIHQSEIAVKMRLEIAKWVAAGKSDQEILDTYTSSYGSKVLVDPRTIPRGWTPFSVACLDPGSLPGRMVAETLERGPQDRNRVFHDRSPGSAGHRRRVTTGQSHVSNQRVADPDFLRRRNSLDSERLGWVRNSRQKFQFNR